MKECAAVAEVVRYEERAILRELAKQVVEVASLSEQAEKIVNYKKLNSLKSNRPMVLVIFDSAYQPVSEDDLRCEDSLLRSVERQLRTTLYRHENVRDDWPAEATVYIPLAWSDSGWGFKPQFTKPDDLNGAYHMDTVIADESDFEKMRWPELTVDREKTDKEVSTVEEIIGDIVRVDVVGAYRPPGNPMGIFCTMRGLEQVLLDMYDRPKWLHQVLDFMAQGYIRRFKQMEKLGVFTSNFNNAASWVGSGGLGYTDELPAPDHAGGNLRQKDIWGRSDVQEFHRVAPEMYWEFSMQYQARVLQEFGLAVFACCEAMDGKYKYLKNIPNVRRVSVSPWADVAEAAESLQDEYVYSWKMNPGQVLGAFDEGAIRDHLRHGLQVSKGCQVEIILNGIHSVFDRPETPGRWVSITRDVISEIYG